MIEDKEATELVSALDPGDPEEDRPQTRAVARQLAEHLVLMARAEALDDLGERDAGRQLVEDWVRSGRESQT